MYKHISYWEYDAHAEFFEQDAVYYLKRKAHDPSMESYSVHCLIVMNRIEVPGQTEAVEVPGLPTQLGLRVPR
jgi:hypothetical protein